MRKVETSASRSNFLHRLARAYVSMGLLIAFIGLGVLLISMIRPESPTEMLAFTLGLSGFGVSLIGLLVGLYARRSRARRMEVIAFSELSDYSTTIQRAIDGSSAPRVVSAYYAIRWRELEERLRSMSDCPSDVPLRQLWGDLVEKDRLSEGQATRLLNALSIRNQLMHEDQYFPMRKLFHYTDELGSLALDIETFSGPARVIKEHA